MKRRSHNPYTDHRFYVMHRLILGALIAVGSAVLLTPAAGWAQGHTRSRAVKSKTVSRAAPTRQTRSNKPPAVQKMIFTDEQVTAGRAAGSGSVVNIRGHITHSSLIKIRNHFVPELIKSADNV